MKKVIICLVMGLGFATPKNHAQNDTLTELFRNSYTVFELQRGPNGIYRDSKLFDSTAQDYHPASIANVGMALVALCIANEMGWDSLAEEKVLLTLKTLSGEDSLFDADRNLAGFFRHFLNMIDGTQEWGSEYSTIDTGILMAGALFAKKYFGTNDSIASYVENIWEDIDWGKAIKDPVEGIMYRIMDDTGMGVDTATTRPFNEYMIVAWLAKNAEEDLMGPAHQLWNNHYTSANLLPTLEYENIPILVDNPPNFLSSFVPQFIYYLCHPFTTDSAYIQLFENARKGDSAWWAKQNLAPSFKWGLGAGSANIPGGYHACAINNNPTNIYSPHTIGGFLPIYPEGQNALLELYREGECIYTLPGGHKILWRKSLDDLSWNAPEVQGVDYSTMLFGLATLSQFLGTNFFSTYNNFDFPPCPFTSIDKRLERIKLNLYPNPVSNTLWVRIPISRPLKVSVEVLDLNGRLIHLFNVANQTSENLLSLDLSNLIDGVYFLHLQLDDRYSFQKFVKSTY